MAGDRRPRGRQPQDGVVNPRARLRRAKLMGYRHALHCHVMTGTEVTSKFTWREADAYYCGWDRGSHDANTDDELFEAIVSGCGK